jgi:hypothetical protein
MKELTKPNKTLPATSFTREAEENSHVSQLPTVAIESARSKMLLLFHSIPISGAN